MTNEQYNPCNCGSVDLSELKPYGVESVRCNECSVSLRKQDWNRIMCRSEYHKSLSKVWIHADKVPGESVVPTGNFLNALDEAKDILDKDRSL